MDWRTSEWGGNGRFEWKDDGGGEGNGRLEWKDSGGVG